MKKLSALFMVLVLIATMIVPMQISAAESNYATVMFKVNYQGTQSIDNKYINLFITGGNGSLSGRGYQMTELANYHTATIDTSYGFDLKAEYDNLTHSEILFKDATDEIILVDIVVTDSGITFERVDADADVQLTTDGSGYALAYKVADGGMVYSNKVVAAGNYIAVLSKKIVLDEKNTLEIIEMPFTVDVNDNTPILITGTATQTKPVTLNSGGITIQNDQIEYMGNFLTQTDGVEQITTNADFSKITRKIQSFDETEFYDMTLPNLSVDLTSLIATVNSANLYYYLNLNEFLTVKDNQDNPLIFNYTKSDQATYVFKNAEDAVAKSGTINGSISLDTLFGAYHLNLDLTDFNLSIDTQVDVKASNGSNPGGNDGGNNGGNNGGDPSTYLKNYLVDIKTLEGAPIPASYALYDTSKKEIVIYIPENTTAIVEIRGVNEDDTTTEPLCYSIDNRELPHHEFDSASNLMTLGATHRGYSDGMFGAVDNGPRIELQVFKGKLGIMTVNDKDGLPHSGEINYNISYEILGGDAQGSNSNTTCRNGVFIVPIQDELLSLNYAYAILSPSVRNGQKVQANTPWIDLTSKLLNNNSNYYDLGTTQFQEVAYTGYFYNSDGTTPLNNTHITAYPEVKPSDVQMPPVMMAVGMVDQGGQQNIFYLAPLGELFTENFRVENMDFFGGTTPIRADIKLSDVTGSFSVPKDQLRIELKDDQGNLLINENGYDKHVMMKINDEPYHKSIFIGGGNIVTTGGLQEGDIVNLFMALDEGDFDYAKLNDSREVTFTFTETPGDYEAVDSQGEKINYTVDAQGITHLSLNARKTQLYAKVYQGTTLVSGGVTATLLDDQGLQVASGRVHSGQMVGEGILNIGAAADLVGEYTLVLSNPENTVNYYGKSYPVTLPLSEELVIQMPESRVFGQLSMIPEDEVLFNNNINRVYVNIFDAAGKYVKNALVRNDGLFTAGNLAEGKYYAKVFISPLSNIASKYNSSKMQIFEVTSSDEKATFALPLYQVIHTGHVVTPNGDAFGAAWVRLYNAQNVEVEAVLSNEQGEFQIPKMPDGKYSAKAFGTGGLLDSKFYEFEIKNGLLIGTVELVLSTAELTGRVTGDVNDVNVGLEGIEVLLYDSALNFIASATTATDGSYEFGGLSHESYLIQARPSASSEYVTSDLIAITFDGTALMRDIALEEAVITGRVVTPENIGTGDAWVHLYENAHYLKSLPVDNNGVFKLGGLDAQKEYTVTAESKTGEFQISELTPLLAGTTTIELKLRQDIGATGVLKSEGELLSKVKYLLYDATGKAIMQGTTNVFGEMTLVDLPAGKYYVIIPMNDYHLKAEIQITNTIRSLGDINLQRGVNN